MRGNLKLGGEGEGVSSCLTSGDEKFPFPVVRNVSATQAELALIPEVTSGRGGGVPEKKSGDK